MTPDDLIALGKRAVACKGWRWMPGMRTTRGERVVGASCEYWGARLWVSLLGSDSAGGVFVRSFCDSSGSCLPDLTDPATLGSVLALVREAWGMPTGITVSYSSDDGLWGVSWSGATHGGWCGRGKTEDEALVAALEGAPHGIISGSKDEAAYWQKVSLDEDARIFAMLDMIIEEKETK